MWLCHESIYQALYQPGSGLLRPSRLAPHHRSPLRTERDHRRAHQRTERRRPRFEHSMLTIHQRAFPPDDRSEPGHWEGDLVDRRGQATVIGNPRSNDRQERSGCSTSGAATATRCTRHSSRNWPTCRPVCSIHHLGPGVEMARHLSITASIGAQIYFCDSRSPWQRGSNENTNGILRDYFPKGGDLSVYSLEHLQAVEDELNRRPRLVLREPLSGRALRRTASVSGSAGVATLTGTHLAAQWSVFSCRRQTRSLRSHRPAIGGGG